MTSKPLDLDVIQKWFQAVIAHPDGVASGAASDEAKQLVHLDRQAMESIVTRSQSLSAHDRLSIYANAYYARLLECLSESFPALRHAVGDDAFNDLAFGYLQQHPSQSYTLNHLGDRFADYLDATRPPDADWADLLVDLAKLEWTVGQVFDGPGVEKAALLHEQQWRAIPVDKFHEARVQPVVCLRLLHVRYRIHEYFTAVRRAKPEDDIPLPPRGDQWIAVTRRDYIVRRHDLSRSQYELLSALQQNATIGESIERAAEFTNMSDEELASSLHRWFTTWTADQLFQMIENPV